MKKYYFLILIVLAFLFTRDVLSQYELVQPSHPVYEFLKKMQLVGIIDDYNSANIPVSREKVGKYLKVISNNTVKLSGLDKSFLSLYTTEFEYDISGETKNSSSLFGKGGIEDVFSSKYQKYLYSFTDTNASLFMDFFGGISHRESNGDSIKINSISLGEIGLRVRGTLFNSVGYYLLASNTQKLKGKEKDVMFTANTDPKFKSNSKWVNEYKNCDYFEGYLRYQTKSDWFSFTLGRYAVYQGYGYIDKMFYSRNAIPFDFMKLDLAYKAVRYSFTYGSLKGDSLGIDMSWKNIATHRLDIMFSKYFKLGITESIISSITPFSFNSMNPMSFLITADMSTGYNNTNNSMLGFDFEAVPFKNLAFQGTILIDDINLASIGKNDSTANDNKFGYQIGTVWTEAFTIPNLTLALEYTMLEPYVYSHRSNKNQYTHWGLSLGHALPPNSDEIAAKLRIDFTNMIKLDFLYQFQRSGDGFEYDQFGNITRNYGGFIYRGDLDFRWNSKFLQGHRIDRNIFTVDLVIQPVKQWYFTLKYQFKKSDSYFLKKTFKDSFFFATVSVDY